MWKAAAAVLVLVAVTTLPLTAADDGTYSSKYDSVDLEEVFNNERLFNKYADCILADGEEQCPPDAKELKQVLPEALQTDCAKCTEKQKARVDKVVKFMVDKKKEVWEKLRAKYDPDGTYYKNYERHIKEAA